MSYILVLLMVGVLVLIHELGHLLAAMWVGIPIERFSVGFGPRIAGVSKRGTDYCLSLVPLGGYVLPKIESEEEWSRFSLLQRCLFSLGGPAANFLAALAVLFALEITACGSSLSALLIGPVATLWTMIKDMTAALSVLFRHPDVVSGIVGIVAFGGAHACVDTVAFFKFAALLNVNLALFNLLPLPPLDGGRIIFFFLETIYRPLHRLHLPVTAAGWLFMLALMLYATVLDINHLFVRITL